MLWRTWQVLEATGDLAKLEGPRSPVVARTDDFRSFSDIGLPWRIPLVRLTIYGSESSPCPTMITHAHQIDVVFVIVPHSLVLDIAGPAEAFRLANQHRERRGQPPRFRLQFASHDPTLTTS